MFSKRTITVLLFIFLSNIPLLDARNLNTQSLVNAQSLIGGDLINSGKEYYQKKDYFNAIHEFSKALLVEPGNKEALNYLSKMGMSGGFYGHPNRQLSQIADLAADAAQYKTDFDDLTVEKAKSDELAQNLNTELDHRKRSFQKIVSKKEIEQQILIKSAAQALAAADSLAKKTTHQRKEIASLNTNLYGMKIRVTKDIGKLRAKDQQIQNIEEQFKNVQNKFHDSKRDWRVNSIDYENKLLTMEQEISQHKDSFAKTDEQRQERIKNLRENLRKSLIEAGNMRDRLILSEYKLAHRTNQLAYQDKRIKVLKESLIALEKELPEMPVEMKAKTQALIEDFPPLSSESEKAEFLKRQDRVISELKERLLTTNRMMEEFKKASPNQEQTAELMAKIQGMTQEIRERDSAFEDQTKDYQMLETRLKDTQQRLQFVESAMQEREQEIKDLEEQLNNVLGGAPDR